MLAGAGAASAVHLTQRDPQTTVLDRLPPVFVFVEQERGPQVRRDVPVDVLGDRAFVRALHAGEVEPADDALDPGATHGALGLLEECTDLAAEVTAGSTRT